MKKSSLTWILAGAVILLPLFLRPQFVAVDSRITRDLLFCSLSFLIGILYFRRCSMWNNFPAISSLIAVIVAHVYVVQWNQASFGVLNQWFCVSAWCIFFASVLSNSDRINWRVVFYAIGISCIIQSVFCILEQFRIFPYDIFFQTFFDSIKRDRPVDAVVGAMGNQNASASMIALCMPAIFSMSRKKYVVATLLVVAGSGLIACKSTMGAAAGLAGVFAYLFYKMSAKQRIASIIAVVVASIAIAFFSGDIATSGSGRFPVWKDVIKFYSNSELFYQVTGLGVGFIYDRLGAFNGVLFRQVHNEYLECLVTFGGILTAIIFGVIINAVIKSKNHTASAIVVATCVNSIGHFALHMSPTAMLFAIAISACLLKERKTLYD